MATERKLNTVNSADSGGSAGSLPHPPTEPLMAQLVAVMARLRTPGTGCPWDLVQTFQSIAPYTIEEAYEVADAIEQEDFAALKSELGDLLLQVVYHARMAEEAGLFAIEDVIAGITRKMVHRHPHVFAEAVIADADAQTAAWEAAKAAERASAAEALGLRAGVLDGVARALPALTRARKLAGRAAAAGISVPVNLAALDQARTMLSAPPGAAEIASTGLESEYGTDRDVLLGDALFALAVLAQRTGADGEQALRRATARFTASVEQKELEESRTTLSDERP